MSFYEEIYPEWPPTLPNPDKGTMLTIENNLVSTPKGFGKPVQAKFGVLALSGQLKLTMTDAQYAIFKTFWRDTLKDGKIPFKGSFFLLSKRGEFRFLPLSKLSRSKTAPDRWSIRFDVWSWFFPTATQEEILGASISIEDLDRLSGQFHTLMESYYDLGNQPNVSYSTGNP